MHLTGAHIWFKEIALGSSTSFELAYYWGYSLCRSGGEVFHISIHTGMGFKIYNRYRGLVCCGWSYSVLFFNFAGAC